MPRCNATYKAGIEFSGWSDRPGHERYFHPFPTDLDQFTQSRFFYATRARRSGRDVPAHPDPFFIPTRIARQGLAPLARPNFPFVASYGYHFDAHLVGAFLRDVGTNRGIRHVDARIASVDLAENGDVRALLADDGRRFEAEVFVDASGFRASIIEGALDEPHRSFAENLVQRSRRRHKDTGPGARNPGVHTFDRSICRMDLADSTDEPDRQWLCLFFTICG